MKCVSACVDQVQLYECKTHAFEWSWYYNYTYSYHLSRFELGLVIYKVLEPLATCKYTMRQS